MTDEARAALNAYRREWRKRNPDKVKATNERYWENRAKRETEERKHADGNE